MVCKPLACAAAVATIDAMKEEKMIENANMIGETILGPGLAELAKKHKVIGDTAPMAAGVIHTDFQKGFIKAEIVSFDDLLEAGSVAEAKSKGKVRMEGKDYVMADGDVGEFRFNV